MACRRNGSFSIKKQLLGGCGGSGQMFYGRKLTASGFVAWLDRGEKVETHYPFLLEKAVVTPYEPAAAQSLAKAGPHREAV